MRRCFDWVLLGWAQLSIYSGVLRVARCTQHYCWCTQLLLKLPKLPLLPAVAAAPSFSLFMNSASIYYTQHPTFKNGTMLPFAHCLFLFSLRCAMLPSLWSVWFGEWLGCVKVKVRSGVQCCNDRRRHTAYEVHNIGCVLVYGRLHGSSWFVKSLRINLIRMYISLP